MFRNGSSLQSCNELAAETEQDLLRNSHPSDKIEAEFTSLDARVHSPPLLHAALNLLQDGSVIFPPACHHVVDDSGKLVCGSG
jgi:hypothetical protein